MDGNSNVPLCLLWHHGTSFLSNRAPELHPDSCCSVKAAGISLSQYALYSASMKGVPTSGNGKMPFRKLRRKPLDWGLSSMETHGTCQRASWDISRMVSEEPEVQVRGLLDSVGVCGRRIICLLFCLVPLGHCFQNLSLNKEFHCLYLETGGLVKVRDCEASADPEACTRLPSLC